MVAIILVISAIAIPNYVPLAGAPPRIDYTLNADPQAPDKTGIRYFYIDSSGVIRQNFGGPADQTSSPVPG